MKPLQQPSQDDRIVHTERADLTLDPPVVDAELKGPESWEWTTRTFGFALNPEVPQSIPGIASPPSSIMEEGEVPDSMDADGDSAAGGAPADAAAAAPAFSIAAHIAAHLPTFEDVVAAAAAAPTPAAPAEQSSCKLSSSTPTLMTKRPKLIEPGSATSGGISSSHASFVSTPSSVRFPQQRMAAGGTLAWGNGMSAAAAAAPAASTRTTLPVSKKLLQMLQSSTAASGTAATPSSSEVLQMLQTSGAALHAATADPHAARAAAGQQHLDPHASAQQVLSLLPSNASSNTAVHGARLSSGIASAGQLSSSKAGQLTSAMTAPGMNAMLTEADPLPAAAAGFGVGVKFSYGALLGGSLASMGKLPAVPGSVTPAGVMQGSAGADGLQEGAATAADDVDIEMLFASEEDALGGTGGGSTAPGQAARQHNSTTAPAAKPVPYTHYLKGARDFCKRMGTNKKAGDEQVAAVAELMQFIGEHWPLVATLQTDRHLCIKEFEEDEVAGGLLVHCMHLALLFGSPDALAKKQQLQQDPEKFWQSQQEELGNIACNSTAGDGNDDYEDAFELALCKSKTKFCLTGKDRKLQSESGGCSSNFKTPKDENFRRAMARFKVMMTLKYKCQRVPIDQLPEALQRLLQELPGPAQPTRQSMPATVTGQNRVGVKRGFGEINFLKQEPNPNLAAADPMQQ